MAESVRRLDGLSTPLLSGWRGGQPAPWRRTTRLAPLLRLIPGCCRIPATTMTPVMVVRVLCRDRPEVLCRFDEPVTALPYKVGQCNGGPFAANNDGGGA